MQASGRGPSVVALLLLRAALAAGDLPLPPNPRYAFQHVGEDQGFGTKTVTTLAEDRAGFLWIGTQDGLFRYDGSTFRPFGPAEGLTDRTLAQVVTAPDGTVWAATQNEFTRFDGRRFPRFTKLAPGTGSQLIAFDDAGQIFLATGEGLFACGPDGKGSRLWPEDGAKADVVALTRAASGEVWFATATYLYTMKGGAAQAVPLPDSSGSRLRAVLADSKGTIWVRTGARLMRREPGATAFVFDDTGLAGSNDFGIPTLDRNDELWVPTPVGLFHKEGSVWRAIGKEQGLMSNAVTAAAEDREGALWVGLGGAGLDRWPGRRSWKAWSTPEGLPNEVAWCFTRDRRGRLFIGTNDGLAMWDGAGWRVWNEKDGLAGRTVRYVTSAEDGSVWAQSIPGGLTRIDGGTLQARKIPPPPLAPDDLLIDVTASPAGVVHVGTRYRLLVVTGTPDSPGFEEVPLPKGLEGTTSFVVFSRDGTLWGAGRNGLSRFDGHNWRLFGAADGIPDRPFYLATRRGNEVWFTYRRRLGVTRLTLADSGRAAVRHFVDGPDGKPLASFFQIGLDAKENLWAGSDAGLVRIDPEGRIRRFLRSDGLIWDDTSAEAFLAEPDGTILVGTSRGVSRYDPAGDPGEPPAPSVLLTSARFGGVDRLGQIAPEIRWKDRLFAAEFTGPTFRSPSEVRFRYRLEGLESETVETSQRAVRYPSLPAGSYRFEVSCRSASGALSAAPASFPFTILAPWWQTLWFRALAAALVGLAAFAGYRARVQRLEERQRQLERLVAERTRALNERNVELANTVGKLSEAQRKIAQLQERQPGSVEDLAGWAAATAREIASALSIRALGVYALDGGRVTPLVASDDPPSVDDVRAARGKPAESSARTLVPLSGVSGEELGAVTLPVRLSTLGDVERQLLDAFAQNLATTLDLRRMRQRLTRAEEERTRSLVDLQKSGIDTAQECPRCGRCYDHRAERCETDHELLATPRILPYRIGGRYRLERLIGEGGMGAVFRVADEQEKRAAALKLIKAEHLHDPVVRLRLEREARIVSRLDHPSVVALYDSGELADGSAFLVMELLPGLDFYDILDRYGPGTPQQVAQLLQQVGPALEAAHDLGVVHRDLKPANIILTPNPAAPSGFQVKVVDFGLAKSVGETTKATRTGLIVGSPAYMSPEQVRDEPLDRRSDLFSLASVTYELLTGTPAFAGQNIADIFTQLLQTQPARLSGKLPGVPRELDKAFQEAFEKLPRKRPKTVAAWVEKLVPLLTALPASVSGWPVGEIFRVASLDAPLTRRPVVEVSGG